MTRTTTGTALAVATIALIVLSGCAGDEAEPEDVVSNTPAPIETPAAEVTPEPLEFTMPTTCLEVLPTARIASFEGEGLVLLGGPDGRYGNDYLADPTPEERAGGISCIWGFSASEISSVTISVAPLSPASRAGIVESFVEEGLNEATAGDTTTFGLQGDEELEPAVMNVLRNESWISVISTIGGRANYDEAVAIASEVGELVYR